MDSPPPPKPEEEVLRTKLRQQLDQSGMSTAVRKIVRNICRELEDVDEVNPDAVINEVYKRGLMSSFMEAQTNRLSNLSFTLGHYETNGISESGNDQVRHPQKFLDHGEESSSSDVDLMEKKLRESGKYYLKMDIVGGRSFLDYLLEEENLLGEIAGNNGCAKLVLHVFYKSQRFVGRPVKCCCDPDFNEVFLIEIERFGERVGSAASKLLSISEPLRVMVVREDVNLQVLGGTVVAYCLHDWRSILISEDGFKNFPLELMGVGPEHNICVGILQVRLNLIPIPKERISETTYIDAVNNERAREEDRERSFVAVAKRWYKEYIEIRADHQFRLIRLFAYDEKMVARPIMTFVKPVLIDDSLATPFQALWFVSLLPTKENRHAENNRGGGGGSSGQGLPGIQNGIGGCLLSERWQTVESSIVSKSGTVEDHAILLTSILLKFGLDAYVGIGTKRGKGSFSWAWTITICENQKPTFWESTTGDYYDHYSYPEGIHGSYHQLPQDISDKLAKNKMYDFLTISCVFNHKGLYANIQPTISTDFVDWNLENPSKWKYLSHENFQSQTPHYPIPFNNPKLNWEFIGKKLECQLRSLMVHARKDDGLGTKWDETLSQFMGQHLSREEMEVSTGGMEFRDYFKSVALKSLPPGYDFRAYTFHSACADAFLLFDQSIREPLIHEIVHLRGDNVTHGLKVKIFPYPEDVPSIRFMVACRYIPTGS